MKNKTVKKIVSLALLTAMLATVLTVFSGCGSVRDMIKEVVGTKVVGTEAAKILLARERLDENTVGQKMAVFSTDRTPAKSGGNSGGFFSSFIPWAKIGSVYSGRMPVLLSKIATGAEVSDSKVVWSSFKQYSDLRDNYTQFIDPIDEMAAQTAEQIVDIKENVGITDKWIDIGNTRYMLIVDDNSETILEYYEPYDSISVSTRYTTEDAKNIYEMYSFMNYDDGTTGDIRNICIPGEYYEYAYRNSGGFYDYFIADNSRGYWIMNRFHIYEQSVFFDMSAVKGDIGYGASINATEEQGRLVTDGISAHVNMFLPNTDSDLFEISSWDNSYNITLFMSNVESGIASLSTSRSTVSEEDYNESGFVYLYGNGSPMTDTVDIHLSNGNTIKSGDGNGRVTYDNARVTYSPGYNGDTYVGRLTFNVDAENENDAMNIFYSYLDENGIKLRVKGETVNEAYNHCELLCENFDIMEWNGLRMNSLSNLRASEQHLIDDYAKYRGIYENAKNNETVSGIYTVARSTEFGKMELVAEGTSTYANGIISIDGLTAKATGNVLFEDGKEYTLKVGLALRDADGNISSVNTVSLQSDNEKAVSYNGDGIEMSQTAHYTVPKALSEGEYIVVVYFATADSGIRVTEMFPVAFFSAEEGTLESSAMDVTVKKSGANLFIDYGIKLFDKVEAELVKESYTYDEIESILLRGVLAKGYPSAGAVVENEAGEALSESGSYGSGTYRIKYLVNTSDGLAEAYMCCTLG